MTSLPDNLQFRRASSFTLDELADIFTRSFEGYFYAGGIDAQGLARRVRVEQIDLHQSVVMMVGADPAGQALLGIRGDRGWCGGFGILTAFRGQGFSHALIKALLDKVREAGITAFSLEVLTRNAPAIATYTRAGLVARRDLQILEWHEGTATDKRAAESHAQLVPFGLSRLSECFARLHPVPAAWQRDLPALLASGNLQGLGLEVDGQIVAYVLFQRTPTGSTRITDLGAETPTHARMLLAHLQSNSTRIISVNEPTDSPITSAFLESGFVETDRQHELHITL